MESPGSSGGRLTRSEILALDVATTTGYYSLHGSGAWRFHATRHCRTYLAFYRTLREFVNAASLKKFATGNGRADKGRMIAACIDDYRFHPSSHDEADAFLLFHYYVRKYRIR